MPTPVRSSPWLEAARVSRPWASSSRVQPPPAMMPSSTAARVALRASSMRSLRFFSSVSVGAPTLITATPPANLAIRSLSFSRSYSESVLSSSRRIEATRSATAAWWSPLATIVVLSLVMVMRRAWPSSASPVLSRVMAWSSLTTVAPVRMAMSPSMALRRSPKPGARTAATWSTPRFLFTTRVARASPSTSSARINRGRPPLETASSTGTRSAIVLILRSVIRIRAFSKTHSRRSWSVTK